MPERPCRVVADGDGQAMSRLGRRSGQRRAAPEPLRGGHTELNRPTRHRRRQVLGSHLGVPWRRCGRVYNRGSERHRKLIIPKSPTYWCDTSHDQSPSSWLLSRRERVVKSGAGGARDGLPSADDERLEEIYAGGRTHEYAPVAGLPELREAIAELYNCRYRRGVRGKYSAENVAISSGGRVALTRVLACLGSVNVGHFLPDYTAYEELLGLFRTFVPIPILLRPENRFSIDSRQLEQIIREGGLGALLYSNPCNPTGHIMGEEEHEARIAVAREVRCAIISDESYSHYVYGEPSRIAVSSAAYVREPDRDPVVIIDGLTKNWRYPGLRLAWAVGPSDVIEQISSAGSFICFAGVGNLSPSVASGALFCDEALRRRVITVPGDCFDIDPGHRRSHLRSPLQSYIRLSFGPHASEVESGLDGIESMVKELDWTG